MAFPSDEAVKAALNVLPAADPAGWAPVIAAACRKHGIDTPKRVAAFLGNIVHESGGMRSLVENLNYPRDRLIAVFGASRGMTAKMQGLGRPDGSKVPLTEAQQQALANCVYGGAWGAKNLGNTHDNDGWYFRGKGLIQLTGRANHTRFARVLGIDVVQLQDLLVTREGAADAAAHFWIKAGCNGCADCGDDAGARRLVNGGSVGLEEVEHLTDVALRALNAPLQVSK